LSLHWRVLVGSTREAGPGRQLAGSCTVMAPASTAKALWFDACSSKWVMAEQPGEGHRQPPLPACGSVLLSPLDHFSAHAYGYTVYGFVYPGALDDMLMKRSLARLLPWYPLLAGRAVSSQTPEVGALGTAAWCCMRVCMQRCMVRHGAAQ
jgi:hypothetical protein